MARVDGQVDTEELKAVRQREEAGRWAHARREDRPRDLDDLAANRGGRLSSAELIVRRYS